VLHRSSKVIFEFIGVYGPADHSRAQEFLDELEDKVSRANTQWWWVVTSILSEELRTKITVTSIGLEFTCLMTALPGWL
jgi:hypothetical protein